MAKSERLAIRLSIEDRDWLADRADAIPALSGAAEGGPAACCGGFQSPLSRGPTPPHAVGAARFAKVRFL
jgi:hypothetical protein